MSRLDDLRRFYDILACLEERVGGKRHLRDFSDYRDWPHCGVYIFFEAGEERRDSGTGPRVVRIGIHALKAGSKSTLRQRLDQHRGSPKGSGNHRGSIFRLLVGQALIARGDVAPCPSWGVKSDLGKAATALQKDREDLRAAERPVEEAVSRYIGAMPFLWLDIGDDSAPESERGYIERNAIALLSNHSRPPLDPHSTEWLGQHSDRALVIGSGLWNQRHVTEPYAPDFLAKLNGIVDRTAP